MKKIKEIIIGILLLVIAGAVVCIYKIKKENDAYQQDILIEKKLLKKI